MVAACLQSGDSLPPSAKDFRPKEPEEVLDKVGAPPLLCNGHPAVYCVGQALGSPAHVLSQHLL